MKILAGFYTHNKLRPKLLEKSLENFLKAAGKADVVPVVSSWEAIPGLSCSNLISRYKNNGHLNIILQLYHIVYTYKDTWDYFAFCEHDCLYPETYFTDAEKILLGDNYTGLVSENHIGMRPSGYCDIGSPTHPLFTIILSRNQTLNFLETKLKESVIGTLNRIEPDNREKWYFQKRNDKFIPVVHVNMDATMNNHHLTNHYDFYKPSPFSTSISYWGDYKSYNIFSEEEIEQSTNPTITIGNIKILDAIYGEVEIGKTVSFINALRKLSLSNDIHVTNTAAGSDPSYLQRKKLRIKYLKNNIVKYIDITENDFVKLKDL